MKIFKKSLSVILAVMMLFSIVSVATFSTSAAETPMSMVVGQVDTSFSAMYDSYSAMVKITATSSNPEVATIVIDSKAEHSVTLTAISVGQTTITVYAGGSVYQTIRLTVTDEKHSGLSGRYVLVHNTGDIGYFSEDGTITFTASQEDYVWVRNYDTGIQYCTDGWQGFVDEVTLVNEKVTKQFNKLYVPAGTHTFTLEDNGNDTFNLSRTETESTKPTGSDKPTPTGSVSGKYVLVCDQGDLGYFTDGAITCTFAKDSYVWVRKYDTGVQYCTDGWQGFVDTVTLVNEKNTKQFNKLYVSAGTHTLVLIDNQNDTFTLSYGEIEPTEPTEPKTQPVTTPQPTTSPATQPIGSAKFVLVCDKGDLGFFENGTLTCNFAQDSYVWIRNYDTGVQYCTDGWQGFVDKVTLVNEKVTNQFNKLYVPAGEQTFALVDNGDDTFTLSYGDVEPTEPTEPKTQPVTTPQPTTSPATQPIGSAKFVLVCDKGDLGFFENGTLTCNFAQDSYVWIRNYDTGVQYCTDGWQGFVDEVTLVNEKVTNQFNKLYVPAGEQTFALVDNGDDTFTLSYGDVEPTQPTTEPVTQPTTDNNRDVFVVLGDSIAAGYGLASADSSYANLIAEEKDYSLKNYAVSGHNSSDLLNVVSTNSDVAESISKAKIVSISIGGNDMLQNLTAIITNVAIGGPDCEYVKTLLGNLENNLNATIKKIRELNPDAEIVLQTIYNSFAIKPVYTTEYNKMLEILYPKMNQTFVNVAGNNENVYVSDVYTAFANDFAENKNPDIIQADGIHPSEAGHQIIFNTLLDTINSIENPEKSYILGDADGNGEVDISDVTIIQKYINESASLDDMGILAADIDKDGTVNINDATYIQKYLANFETIYPINEKIIIK